MLVPPEKDDPYGPVHPADVLSREERCRIYYSRVVDLAVARGLLSPDPNTEIGHFAFSPHYLQGKDSERALQRALREFEEKYPEVAVERRTKKDQIFLGAVRSFLSSDSAEKAEEIILVGATYCVWPVGTSFALTYPWDLSGKERPVRFRKDLNDFMKRRIIAILRKAGKLGHSDLFGTW
ncbi:MAG: hypothetical protein WBG50_09195 [Desulfomonilaceae bacterium]